MGCATLAAVGMHIASWHSAPGYNNANPGLYARVECGLQVGAYYNSERRPSAYGAYVLEVDAVFASAGIVTGYAKYPVPLVNAGLKLGPIRLVYVPKIPKHNETHVIHVAVERRF